MGTLFREAFLILVIVGCAWSGVVPTDCPRDCICTTEDNKIFAKCNRLEVGTQKFSNVDNLIIENSKDVKLTDKIFVKLNLKNVKNIKIKNSFISKVSSSAFADLHDLFSLDLSGNKISYLHPDTFNGNILLNLINLSENPLAIENITTPFLNSVSVQELDLSNCGITSLTAQTFNGLTSINMINLSGNKLQELDPDLFTSLSSLEEVDLSYNYIKNFPVNLFSNNNYLNSLILSHNPITDLSGLAAPELTTLRIENAKLRSLNASSFEGVPYVENILLSGNEINQIADDTFEKLGDLSHLDLSNNKLENISSKLIHSNNNLDILKIANNTLLRSLPEGGFIYDVEEPFESDLFGIYLFDASGCSLENISNNTFETMPALTQIDLSRNRITSIGSALSQVKELTRLDISNNMIEIIDKFTFAKNTKLKTLKMSGNPLVSLSPNLFESNNALSWLDVSNCQLFTLWGNAEKPSPNTLAKLSYLNASHNKIISIHGDELELMKNLVTLDITENPLWCNLEFKKLMTWLGEHKVSPNSRDMMASNLQIKENQASDKSEWKTLSQKVCNFNITSNMTEFEKGIKKIEKNVIEEVYEDDDDYDEDDSDDDYDEDDSYDAKNNDTVSEEVITYEKLDDALINGKDILESSHKEIKIEKIKSDIDIIKDLSAQNDNENDDDDDDDNSLIDNESISDIIDEVNKNGGLANSVDVIETDMNNVLSRFSFDNDGVSIILLVSCFLIILFVFAALIRVWHLRAAHKHLASTMRRGNNFIYRPLSEELSGPKTPIFQKNMLIGSIISESMPLHKDKIVPVDV